MREIKFRAWFEMEKQMVTHDRLSMSYDNGEGFTFAFDDWARNDDGDEKGTLNYILMQYTGLKDKNGKEIYEGDVLRVYEVTNYREQEYVAPVVYIESGFLVTEPDDTQVPLAYFYNPERTYNLFETEIIGNIYENSELLEVQE